MSIVFYFPNLRPGGAERVMLQLLNFFHNRGLTVSLLLGKKEGQLLTQLNPQIPVYELGTAGARGSVFSLIKFCRKHQPDILFATLGASVAAALAKPFLPRKTKLISRLGNTIGAERKIIKSFIRRMIVMGLLKLIANKSDIVVFQSHYMKRDFLKFIEIEESKCRVIYNPVNIPEVNSKATEEAINSDLLAIGRLMEQKDYFTLIQSIAHYKRITSDSINLNIVGEGPLENELKKLVKSLALENEVHFLGFQANPYRYLSKSKYLISSSLYEGFSNVILESLALGVPVIATDCPSGNREVLEENVNGFFTEVGDSEKMANTINLALENRPSFDSTKIAADLKAKFDLQFIGEQYASMINEFQN
ncbi:glycosyltransferase [Pontibacter roseus]|uniref:glycosyltransferase n=1 Tax=Pontibacter roseus TaxID=336989 RepID=UPI0003769001|nr:glycosyltransferase [Pontibacter roseus]